MIRTLYYWLRSLTISSKWIGDGRLRLLIETNAAFSETKWNLMIEEFGVRKKYQVSFYRDKFTGYKLAKKADVLFAFGVNTAFDLRNLKMFYSGISGVTGLPGFNGVFHSCKGMTRQSVAEYCYQAAVYLTCKDGSVIFDAILKSWRQTGSENQTPAKLKEKKIGILGLGMNGSAVSDIFRNAGCRVYGYDTDITRAVHADVFCGNIEELLRNSDILIITVKADDLSEEIITKRELLLMPENSYLVNVSRGSVLNEIGLAELLESGRLSGAVLDVTRHEENPGRAAHPEARNLLVTPHISGNINPFADEIMSDFFSKLKSAFPDG